MVVQLTSVVLRRLLREIAAFIKTQDKQFFLQALFAKDRRIAMIEGYHRRLNTAVASFQVSQAYSLCSLHKPRATTVDIGPARQP
jgi:hypothetical protein